MPLPELLIDGVRVPRFLYGTAWKEEATQRLTESAVSHGFRGIDTANQRKHYFESGVGAAVKACIDRGLIKRDELFLQSKFTFLAGQDHRLPYDPNAEVQVQVEQSFASSCDHLGTKYLDAYILHGPSSRTGLNQYDWNAWNAIESLHDSGRVRLPGISNVSLSQLQLLVSKARVRPRFVQNRCYAATRWDQDIRQFCTANGITYQGFSLLTANRSVLIHPEFLKIAQRHARTASQVVFRFAVDVGMLPLTGTTSPEHMKEDLAISEFELSRSEVELIERLAAN